MIVSSHLEGHLFAAADRPTLDSMVILIDSRQSNANVWAAERDSNLARVGPWRHNKIELQLARIPIVDYVDPWINVPVANAAVIGHVRSPFPRVAVDQIIAVAGQQLFGLRRRTRPRAN